MGQNGKIEILHIITRLIRGGADENTISNIRGLDKKIHSVDFLVGGETDFSYLDEIGKDARSLVIPQLKRNIHPLHDLIAFFKIFKVISKNKYHIVHTHTAKGGFIGRIAAALAGTPIILHTLHGVTFHDFMSPLRKHLYILLERLAALVTDLFIT
ncbi:glycosyltransferase family 1 protein, partial [candidate division KSB1 bacterium]